MNTILSTISSQLVVQNNYLCKQFADQLYKNILTNQAEYPLEKQPKGFAYGKEIIFHRSIGFFSDTSIGYKFSKQISKAIPLPQECKVLLAQINKEFNTNYNGILINVYAGGVDYISAHSDDEKELDQSKSVIVISLGESRIFRVRPKDKDIKINSIIPQNNRCKTPAYDIPTEHGQLIGMGGNFQSEFTHEIPIEKNKTNIRISLTFRYHSV
jgi:alkylated DNA repair dioxygenase AlkB